MSLNINYEMKMIYIKMKQQMRCMELGYLGNWFEKADTKWFCLPKSTFQILRKYEEETVGSRLDPINAFSLDD